MGLPYVPPEPPVVVEKPADTTQQQFQEQFQDQQQQNTIGELLQEQRTESDADSNARSSSSNSSSQTNVQVNNNSNRVEYGSFKIPETTLNLNGYITERGDFGAVFGVNVPIGGKSRSTIRRALDIRAKSDKLAFEQNYSSVCANIQDGGFVVAEDAGTLELLSRCSSNIRRTKLVARNAPPKVVAPATNNVNVNVINELRQENQEMKALIAELLKKIDTEPVKGGY